MRYYHGLPSFPPKTGVRDEARYEHAFLLRCEGLKYSEIADHLGVTPSRARDMAIGYPFKWLNRAIRRTRFYWTKENLKP